MATLHFRHRSTPVGKSEINDPTDVDTAVIDAPLEQRWLVGIDNNGRVSCQMCTTDDPCDHEKQVQQALEEWGVVENTP